MKYFVLTLFFCAFVATAFSVPVAQDEAQDIANKISDAIPKLQKAVQGLRAEGQNEAADKVENVIPLLKIWTNRETVASNIQVARTILRSVENLLNVTRRYWENNSLSLASVADVNEAISELFVSSEAQELVDKFSDAIPKLVKIEAGLRADGNVVAADKIKKAIHILKKTYTNLELVEENLVNARQVWRAFENILKHYRKYWDNTALTVSTLSNSLAVAELLNLENSFAALDKTEDQEVAEIVKGFVEAIPKLHKIANGLRAEGREQEADNVEKVTENLVKYTEAEYVKAHKILSKIVLKGVQIFIKLGKKYLEEETQSVIVITEY